MPVDYQQKEGPETTLQYATRLARCVVSDLILADVVSEDRREAAVDVAGEQIFHRLAIGDSPPPEGST
jgi:hypothetical protein